jgi:hypothetical protein
MADTDDIHLATQTFMRSIYRYHSAIPAQSRMRVNPVLAVANVHAAVAFQFGQRHK